MGNWIFFVLDTAWISLEIRSFSIYIFLSRCSLETLAICQEFLSAKRSLPGGQHRTLWCFAAGVGVCGLFICCTCAQTGSCEPRLNLCSETVSWNHSSWDWTLFPTASSNVWMAANACVGKIHAPCTKRNCPFPFLAKIKWRRHTQLQKESTQEGARWLLVPSQFSAAISKLPLKKNQATKNLKGQLQRKPNPPLASACHLVEKFVMSDVFPGASVLWVTELGENCFLKC